MLLFPEASRRGGVERVVWDVADHFRPSRAVTFVGRSAPDGLPPSVAFRRIADARGPAATRLLAFRRAVRTALPRHGSTLVVSHGVVVPPAEVLWVQSVHRAWLGMRSTIRVGALRIPAAARYAMPRHLTLLAMERQYFRSSQPRVIICTSPREVEDLVDLYGVDPAIARIVPNWYDPRLFGPDRRAAEREATRERLGVPEDGVALLFVANELHRKGFGQLLAALALVGDDRLSLHVVGRAPLTPYAAQIARLGLDGRVRYHGPTADVGGWLAGADLLVLPTQYEPFGIVIIEALATGVPVITTRLAGAAGAIIEGETGLLQDDPHSVEELSVLIARAVAADLPSWSEHAARSVDAYRRDRVMSTVQAIFDSL